MKIAKHVIHIGFSNIVKRQLIMSKEILSLWGGAGEKQAWGRESLFWL